jgi:hypothetical protein
MREVEEWLRSDDGRIVEQRRHAFALAFTTGQRREMFLKELHQATKLHHAILGYWPNDHQMIAKSRENIEVLAAALDRLNQLH